MICSFGQAVPDLQRMDPLILVILVFLQSHNKVLNVID